MTGGEVPQDALGASFDSVKQVDGERAGEFVVRHDRESPPGQLSQTLAPIDLNQSVMCTSAVRQVQRRSKLK